MPNILPPSSDIVFKMLFGSPRNSDILTAFLQAALPLPDDDYSEITLLNPFSENDYPSEKVSILDIQAKTTSGRLLDIEIQVKNHAAMRERIVYYLAKMLAGQISEGNPYAQLKPVICILITDFILIAENHAYHNRYRFRDARTQSEFTDLAEINTLELPKLPNEADGSKLWAWLEFLKTDSKERMEMLAEKNPDVKKAVVRLAKLSADEKARMLHEARLKAEMDAYAYQEDARKLGLAEGREEGRAEGLVKGRAEGRAEGRTEGNKEARLDVVRNMVEMGLSTEVIADATGLPLDEIRALQTSGSSRS
ncbi:MAG: Rpn family recombination-promoting nuclease/putative transposase [Betaproteobacteria bacterium]|nr:Rpn family recombination-promoting nuclease/putative transposase [Betaproteobacteria bacterium]